MITATVTINTPDSALETEYTAASLDLIWSWVQADFPDVTSVVLTFVRSL